MDDIRTARRLLRAASLTLLFGVAVAFAKVTLVDAPRQDVRHAAFPEGASRDHLFHVSYRNGEATYVRGDALTVSGDSYVISDHSRGIEMTVAAFPVASVEGVVAASNEEPATVP